ncbi:MAG: ABC transporter substrate-binding protein [Salibacteraceae bacterium]
MKNYFLFLPVIILLNSCGEAKKPDSRIAKGDVQLGGVFRVNEVMDMRSLFPLEITEMTGFQVASQVYESMVKFNSATLEPEPGLAESWESNEDATTWTFKLRKGIFFHDDPCFPKGKGREFKADDVRYVFEQLCTPSPQNQMFWVVRDRLKGARKYHDALLNNEDPGEFQGVEVVDDYTVKIHLNFPFASFLRLMGHNAFYIYPKEAKETYGEKLADNAVGTGAFVLKVFKRDENVVLNRNPNYWNTDKNGNALPYLDAVQISFVKDKKSELLMFKNGELDMIFTLPIEMYDEVMGGLDEANFESKDYRPQVKPSLSVHYYSFQHAHPVFSDARVRKAFNLAIDRESLINYTLQGEGTPGKYGIVPPVFKNYPHQMVNGIAYNPEKARTLLTEAGYPNGEGFPVIKLQTTSGGQNYEVVAQVIQQMLKDQLNIDLEIEVLSMAQQGKSEEIGESVFWRSAWLADYPDPENFLCLFLGDDIEDKSSSYLNTVNYHNELYDSLYQAGIRELDEGLRYRIFSRMDQILINDAVIMPLYYEEFTRLIPTYVKGFPQNSMEHRDYSKVWFDASRKAG